MLRTRHAVEKLTNRTRRFELVMTEFVGINTLRTGCCSCETDVSAIHRFQLRYVCIAFSQGLVGSFVLTVWLFRPRSASAGHIEISGDLLLCCFLFIQTDLQISFLKPCLDQTMCQCIDSCLCSVSDSKFLDG